MTTSAPPCAGGARAPRGGPQDGATAVELAIVLPVMLAVVFGIVLTSIAVFLYTTAAHAAREGARYAIVRGATPGNLLDDATDADVRAVVQRLVKLGPPPEVTTVWRPDKNPGSVVEVTARIPFTLNLPFVPFGPVTFSSTSRMVIAH
jgi:Flp pilus assembly protein TadG